VAIQGDLQATGYEHNCHTSLKFYCETRIT
jgi:hypothetical protein